MALMVGFWSIRTGSLQAHCKQGGANRDRGSAAEASRDTAQNCLCNNLQRGLDAKASWDTAQTALRNNQLAKGPPHPTRIPESLNTLLWKLMTIMQTTSLLE